MNLTYLPRGYVRGKSDDVANAINELQPVLMILHLTPGEWGQLAVYARHVGKLPADVLREQILPVIGCEDKAPGHVP
jgi:hypothetical protein